jgi:hypothetical protein
LLSGLRFRRRTVLEGDLKSLRRNGSGKRKEHQEQRNTPKIIHDLARRMLSC